MPAFLFEIGLEEIPARMIAGAQKELAERVMDLLSREHLLLEGHSVVNYSTPRRLAVVVEGVAASQPDSEEQMTGPAAKIAFKEGEPTAAAIAFAKKAGVGVEALTTVSTAKGEYVSVTIAKKGKTAAALLEELLPRELAAIYWAKSMYWRPNKPERFVRPLQWMVALLDEQIVPIAFAGVVAGNQTYGHRVLHGEEPLVIAHQADYLEILKRAYVMADVAARRQRIRKALDAATRAVAGGRWREDEALVETVTHLTEWPSVVLGTFEAEYLALPEEVLVTVMRDHQKYFAVEDSGKQLTPHFLAVLNTEVDEQGMETIRHGNARVLRARFNDARFFWNYDQKTPLDQRNEMLKSVTFQKDYGNYFTKSSANVSVALRLAEQVPGVDKAALRKATELAKMDLTTELVKEFTELQGIVGGLYARAQGQGETVAMAIYTQYLPASMEDPIPSTVEGQLLGIADRMKTIDAMFALGLEPTGSKDPFALRRAANGVVKILAESRLPLKLSYCEESAALIRKRQPAISAFLKERLEFYLREVRGFRYDYVQAVLAVDAEDVNDALARLEDLTALRGSDDLAAVSAAFKRIKNILRQAPRETGEDINAERLVEQEERDLYAAMQTLLPLVRDMRSQKKYRAALEKTAQLRPAVDAFFDKVMVMAPDESLRNNRLALITAILNGFSGIADLSEIVAG